MICKKCVLDDSVKELELDEQGVCQFCHQAEKSLEDIKKDKLPDIKGKVLIGLSGGVDSSMVLHHAVKMGLKVMTYSVDTGYNNPKSDENILRMVEKLKVPFYRYTIDLDRFKDLQMAFIKAGVINVEIPTDHILLATTYEMANKYNCKWILSGGNVESESVMPPSWSYNARDLTHIKDIYRKMTGRRLKGLPLCSLLKLNYYWHIKGIKIVYLLDFVGYNRGEAIKLLEREYQFQTTGEKHEDNIFTQWYQSFYLFEKYGIDKRKAHFSSLINSGQMTREDAITRLQEQIWYPKFGIEQKVLEIPIHAHEEYKQDKNYERIAKICRYLATLRRRLLNHSTK